MKTGISATKGTRQGVHEKTAKALWPGKKRMPPFHCGNSPEKKHKKTEGTGRYEGNQAGVQKLWALHGELEGTAMTGQKAVEK